MATQRKKKNESIKAMDIVAALGAVTKEKSISMDLVLDSLKDALASAAKKYLNTPIHVEIHVDREKGTIEAFTLQYVVAEVEDPEKQIDIDEARKIDKDLEIGDEVVGELDINEFGRAAIQTAKQIIMQRVREFERDKIFRGLEKACWKRPISHAQIETIVNLIECEVTDRFEVEVDSHTLGQIVMAYLKKLDQVAYVRFASVYRQFKDVRDFVDELQPILQEQSAASALRAAERTKPGG